MYLQRTRELNAALILRAAELHQAGAVPPACYVVDADTVRLNSEQLSGQARDRGIRLFFMSKQIGHNPEAVTAIRSGGLDKTVAVDARSAELLGAQGVPLANVGHLSQVPARQLPSLLARHQPEFVTVYNVAQARQVAQAAASLNEPLQVLAKVRPDGPVTFPGQEGGFYLDELSTALPALSALPGIRLRGVTAFPCTAYERPAGCFRPTRELAALQKAAELIGDHIGQQPQVNAPGNTSAQVLDLLASCGCTSAEPGHALTGTGPQHANGQGPERPAVVYVSEIVQVDGPTAIAFGGGLYRRGNLRHALVGSDAAIADSQPLEVQLPGPEYIDYYFTIKVPPGRRISVGDTVITALRPQIFVGYSRVVAVGGLHTAAPSLGPVRDSQGLADPSWKPAAR